MATAAENERLGVLETEVAHIKQDVGEIKSDVKSLIATQMQLALNLAVKEKVEDAAKSSRASTGMWVRFFSERLFSLLALAVAVYSILKG